MASASLPVFKLDRMRGKRFVMAAFMIMFPFACSSHAATGILWLSDVCPGLPTACQK